MNVEVQDLRVLRAVADAGSLAGAARLLGVGQAGITRRIQHLERATGLVVLRRDHRGARLTTAGRLLLLCADDLLPRIDHLLTVKGRGGPAAPGRLRIGTVPAPLLPLVAARAGALRPQTEVELYSLLETCRPSASGGWTEGPAALPDLFRVHRLDLAVVRHSALDAALPDVLAAAVLAEEDMLIGLTAGHRLADRPALALGDLDGEVCVLPAGRRHAGLRRHFTAAAREAGIHVEVRYASGQVEAAALACAVRGVLPAYPFPAPAVGVDYAPLTDPAAGHRLLLVWPRHGGAADWAPGLAGGVREAYRGAAGN
ncbi:LysR family transcriptional regulator [Streptomyces sp. SudanB25_2051]|uniref:LysR family transcriptional regulator n=1 Tax=Streptomyces sp. SudanB25_2051 TaxID=3035275 RepID=UPI003F579A24